MDGTGASPTIEARLIQHGSLRRQQRHVYDYAPRHSKPAIFVTDALQSNSGAQRWSSSRGQGQPASSAMESQDSAEHPLIASRIDPAGYGQGSYDAETLRAPTPVNLYRTTTAEGSVYGTPAASPVQSRDEDLIYGHATEPTRAAQNELTSGRASPYGKESRRVPPYDSHKENIHHPSQQYEMQQVISQRDAAQGGNLYPYPTFDAMPTYPGAPTGPLDARQKHSSQSRTQSPSSQPPPTARSAQQHMPSPSSEGYAQPSHSFLHQEPQPLGLSISQKRYLPLDDSPSSAYPPSVASTYHTHEGDAEP